MKEYFQDPAMQGQYEELVKEGVHYRVAIRKIIQRFEEYDNQ